MRIDNIQIEYIAGIKKFSTAFDPKMNLICGPNGIGKTTILECVAQMFAGMRSDILKRNVNSVTGTVAAQYTNNGLSQNSQLIIAGFKPSDTDYTQQTTENSKKLLSLKVARSFGYFSLDAISRDSERNEHNISSCNKGGINLLEIKNWFVNRFIFSKHENSMAPEETHNFNLVKSFFGLLNPEFHFSRVDGGTHEIMVNTPTGEIYYEYLSSGFKSCLAILFGITKEIEFIFKNPSVKIDQFDGIILIDEIELH